MLRELLYAMVEITYTFEQEDIWIRSIHNAFVLSFHMFKIRKHNSYNLSAIVKIKWDLYGTNLIDKNIF